MKIPLRIVPCALVIFALLTSTAAAQAAHWIWPVEKRSARQVATFSKSFTCPSRFHGGQLSGVADFCRMTIRLNGTTVVSAEGFEAPFQRDVSRWLHPGENRLEVSAAADEGPAAIALRLEVVPLEGSKLVVVTDSGWSSALADGSAPAEPRALADLGAVDEFELDPQRQFGITALDDYEQWKQALPVGSRADPSAFLVSPGFKIELVHSARPEEGSWVSMAFDPRGRIVIGREDKGLLRMTLADGGGSVSSVETVNDSLLECRGLLFAHDSLYANANNSKALYRLRDTDGDDRFDQELRLREFEGSLGHGRNDLTAGPDGGIYLIHGDAVDLPENVDDLTSPFREHRRGRRSKEGHVLRTDRDGQSWQLIAAGLRNPYGIAFHRDGEMFTYDADAEFDMGSPWYRPTQVKHLVAGADFGWRGVTGRWPPYYHDHPDNALPSVHIGKGSPTSVQFGYASRFPERYREALYILDWAYGRIIAVHLFPRGASYAGKPENFLKGRPLNVTDLDFGPDGAMYFVTGGRKTQAGLYRVRYVGPEPPAGEKTRQRLARDEFSVGARRVRHQLESLLAPDAQGANGQSALHTAWEQLDDADPWLRYAARSVIERRPFDQWRDRVFDDSRTWASLTALMAAARGGDEALLSRILTHLNGMPLGSLTTSQKVTALYIYQLCLADPDQRPPAAVDEAARRLDAIYPDLSVEVNCYLSALLARLEAPGVVAKTMAKLTAASDQAEQMQYLFVLRTARGGWTPELRQSYADALRRSATYLGGEGMPGFLRQIRDDWLAAAPPQERDQLASLVRLDAASDESPLPARPQVQSWTMADLDDVANHAPAARDLANGRRMFDAALCSRCHRVGAVGQLVGPDLTGVSRRFSRRDILQSIVDPSAVVAENYRNDRIETHDGRVFVGRIGASGDFRLPVLRIVTDPLRPGQFVEIAKRDIASHVALPTSPMPAGLLNTLTRDDILDLLGFLESGGVEH
jgi:putative heme-binding domain-containing protein